MTETHGQVNDVKQPSDLKQIEQEISTLVAAGLGESDPITISNLDEALSNGWYAWSSTTLNRPNLQLNGFSSAGTVLVVRRIASRVVQIACGASGNRVPHLAVRTLGSSGWGSWYRLWHEENLVKATQVIAEEGTNDTRFMTPLRTKQAITKFGNSFIENKNNGKKYTLHVDDEVYTLRRSKKYGDR
ncbi:pyocin knob domain-containing protein [Caldalkalibacillus mannanilyticus]|uniref:pyocin knob domain-containing protein n=1 Tax=Caldalkalibacillus mannanilyticus TaxID=1418 RepID=UPI0004695993|nr:pyocin knob domain-containing protein [Caldalkalibacillus mannanilyticus]